MADDRTPPNTSPPGPGEKRADAKEDRPENNEALIVKIKQRYEDGVGEFEENRRMHSEDLNFVYNAEAQGQWDPVVLEARRGKPSYTFNRVIGPVNLVVADMRQTRPAVKIRPSSEDSSQATAEIFAGLWRSIERNSRAEQIYKNQYKFAVAGGYGAFRIMPEYASDDSFDQVLAIKDIPNPQTVVWDAECADACAGDSMWAIVGERISKEKHRSLFPGAKSPQDFQMGRDSMGWFTDKEVRVVEYMERIPFEKTIAQMSDGTVEDYTKELQDIDDHLEAHGKTAEDGTKRIVKTRKVLKWRVMWVKCDGGQVLEGPEYYDWKRIPIVRVPGRYINIEGKKKFQSLVRHSKDAQRSYNSRCSDMIERSALTPKAPYLATETMIKGYENEWAQANTASRPYLPYNVDAKAEAVGGMPVRTPPIDMPQAAIALAQQAASDIQATTGFFDPALGNAEDMNRVSGKALVQHTRRSDLGSFEFIDGFGDAIQLAAEMGLDMIPSIYDTERVETIIGQDGMEKLVKLNAQDPQSGDIMNDLSKGRYACTVTIGPSYQTARQETLATLIDAAETIPSVAQMAPDLIAKNIDSPDADELARRLRIPLIHQGIIQATPEEQKNLPPPPPPDPMKVAELQREQALAMKDHFGAMIMQDKAGNSHLVEHKQSLQAAGIHLTNLKTAKELGNIDAAAQAERQSEQIDQAQNMAMGAQDLQQSDQAHQQDIQQGAQAHQVDIAKQVNEHELNMKKQRDMHAHEMTKAHDKHEMEKKHKQEMHEQDLKHARAMAAAKPKTPKSK